MSSSPSLSFRPEDIVRKQVNRPPTKFSKPLSNNSSNNLKLSLRALQPNPKKTENVMKRLLDRLKRCRRRPVTLNISQCSLREFSQQFENQLSYPLVELFNQLKLTHMPRIERRRKTECDGMLVTCDFSVDSPLERKGTFPIFVFATEKTEWIENDLEGNVNILDPDDSVVSQYLFTLCEKGVSTIVISDICKTCILRTRVKSSRKQDIFYEVLDSRPDYPLRLILASYLYEYLGQDFLGTNDWHLIQRSLGARTNPAIDPPSDHDVFTTRKGLSDFDRYTLETDKEQALQFFRWQKMIHNTTSQNPPAEGNVWTAKTDGFGALHLPLQPGHPLENLPAATTEYLNSTRRPRPFGLTESLERSHHFDIQLIRKLTPEDGSGWAMTFSCNIINIDGCPVTSPWPSLCVKVFDDRLFSIPEPEDLSTDVSYRWFFDYARPEELVRQEEATYKRLAHAQGSVIPIYYGSHLFTMSDGYQAFGILMELVPGEIPSQAALSSLSDECQADFIKSARHAVRVFQYADISQLDWCEEQIICSPVLSATGIDRVTCVFLDFTFTTLSNQIYDSHRNDDYGLVEQILCDEVGLRKNVLKQPFEPREAWDWYTSQFIDKMAD
ncbi:hypothetical protein K439DRAFT_1659243 [Ramaria rubella]|nr:hypothetical protein K439DRAFT_1659243 [Ramaria rubella]